MPHVSPAEEVPEWFLLAEKIAHTQTPQKAAWFLAEVNSQAATHQKGFVSNLSACLLQEAERFSYALARYRLPSRRWKVFRAQKPFSSRHLGAGKIRSRAMETLEFLQRFERSELSDFADAFRKRVHEYRRLGHAKGVPYFAYPSGSFAKDRLPLDVSSRALEQYRSDLPVCTEEAICQLHYVDQPLYHAIHGNPCEAYGLLKATATDPHEFPNFAPTKGLCALLAIDVALSHRLGTHSPETSELRYLAKTADQYLRAGLAQAQTENQGPTLLLENSLFGKLPKTLSALNSLA